MAKTKLENLPKYPNRPNLSGCGGQIDWVSRSILDRYRFVGTSTLAPKNILNGWYGRNKTVFPGFQVEQY